ncbi:MAG: Hsp20/alpha crystallin family protein [Deltaproteobacteria bacterium]|nr:Hsp20/alpha crystallin family protein [Deltaproteobacteria bacterium]
MALYRWTMRNPFVQLHEMQDEMARLMRELAGDVPQSSALPQLNVYDDGEAFRVRAELPGLKRDKLDIQVAGDVLTIKAERPPEESNGSYHRRERSSGAYSRSVTLPDAVDVDHVRANYQHGVLEVMLPRAPESRPRKIAIESR